MKFRIIFFYTALLFLCSSCDCIRATLGMATSKDIAIAKDKLENKALEQQRIKDSIEVIAYTKKDSSILKENLGYTGVLNKEYYIITGSFKDEDNTNSMLDFLKKQGYEPIKIRLKNGSDMVSLCGYDTYSQAMEVVNEIKNSEVCPYDVWIYDIKQGLHE